MKVVLASFSLKPSYDYALDLVVLKNLEMAGEAPCVFLVEGMVIQRTMEPRTPRTFRKSVNTSLIHTEIL